VTAGSGRCNSNGIRLRGDEMGDQVCLRQACGEIWIHAFPQLSPGGGMPVGISPLTLLVSGDTITIGDGVTPPKVFEFTIWAHSWGKVDFGAIVSVGSYDLGRTIILTDQNDVVATFEFRHVESACAPGNIWVNTSSDNDVTITNNFLSAVLASGLIISGKVVEASNGVSDKAVWLSSQGAGADSNKPVGGTWDYTTENVMVVGMVGGSDPGPVGAGHIPVEIDDVSSPRDVITILADAIVASGLQIDVEVLSDTGDLGVIRLINRNVGPAGNVPITVNWGVVANYPGGSVLPLGSVGLVPLWMLSPVSVGAVQGMEILVT